LKGYLTSGEQDKKSKRNILVKELYYFRNGEEI